MASQIAKRIHDDCGAATFLDVFDIAKGDDIEERIFTELPKCNELVALLTHESSRRNWLWVEVGAARVLRMRLVGVLYGLTLDEFEHDKGGKACLNSTNVADINDLEAYLLELKRRVTEANDEERTS